MSMSKLSVSIDSFEFLLDEILPKLKKTEEILSLIGLFFVGKFVISTATDILVGFRVHILSKLFKKDLVKTYGKWAVITGCTDGIGKAYMNELANRGMDIVLISRNIEKLENCAKEVRDKHGVNTDIIQVDFSDGRPVYEKIEKALQEKEIGILVNNVAMSVDTPKVLTKVSDDEVWGHVNVNVAAVAILTRMVLPQMVIRRQGAIVNVASMAACGPVPYLGIYSATKAFVDYFSAATRCEYEGSGVTFQTLYPAAVATNMTRFSDLITNSRVLAPTAAVYAKNAVNTLGYSSETTGFWPFGLQAWALNNLVTRPVFMFATKRINRMLSKDKIHYE